MGGREKLIDDLESLAKQAEAVAPPAARVLRALAGVMRAGSEATLDLYIRPFVKAEIARIGVERGEIVRKIQGVLN